MKLNIEELLKQIGNKHNFELDLNYDKNDFEASQVKIKGVLLNAGKSILLSGKISLDLKMECEDV